MAELITAEEVIAIAFTDGQYIDAGVIAQCDIDAAIERWVVPVVGRALLEAVAEGKYEELREHYLKPVIALYTRQQVQPRLNVSTSQAGLSVVTTSSRKAADEAARRELQRSLKARAKFLRQRLEEYLDEHKAELTEYNEKQNILKRCRCDGGFVQIH
jgi:hypothetical protein